MTHVTDVISSYIKGFVFQTVTPNNRLFAQLQSNKELFGGPLGKNHICTGNQVVF